MTAGRPVRETNSHAASTFGPIEPAGKDIERDLVSEPVETGVLLVDALRLDYAQFLELEMFSRFGGLTDAHVAGKIARGERIRALIAQPRFSALSTLSTLEEIALIVSIGGRGVRFSAERNCRASANATGRTSGEPAPAKPDRGGLFAVLAHAIERRRSSGAGCCS
ncbi:F0F1-type ATP synthase alpha subunit [Paraburkholderia sp. GAS41]|jgi:F0F1-type ATP synthase alpha subunit